MDDYDENFDDDHLDDDGRPGGRGMKIFLIGCGSLLGLVLLFVMGIGVMMTTGAIPDSVIKTGDELSSRMREQVEEAGILLPSDEVLLFYSYGMWSAAEGGSAITEEGLVNWIDMDGELEINRVPYAAIQSVKLSEPGDFLTDTLLEVETENLYYYPVISTEEGGDVTFRDRLDTEWSSRGGHRPDLVPTEFTEHELNRLGLDVSDEYFDDEDPDADEPESGPVTTPQEDK
jgi:hypothetical protein